MSFDTLDTIVFDAVTQLSDHTDIKVKQLKLQPFGNSTFSDSGTREVVFKLPRDGVLVAPRSFLYFKAEADGDSAGDDEFMTDIHTIFDRFKIEVGTTEVINENEWGWFRTLENCAKMSTTDRESAQAFVMNIPDNSTSGSGKKFRIPLSSKWNDVSFFASLSALPLYKMDQITLTWTLNSSLPEYTTATTAVQSVDLTNVELELYIVDSPKLRSLFNTDVVKSFDTHHHYRSIISSGATSVSVAIPANFQNLRSIAGVMRDSTTATDPNWFTGSNIENDKYTHSLLLNGLSKYNVNIDGVQYPSKDIDATNSVELVTNLEHYWDLNRLGAFYGSNVATSTNGTGYPCISFSATDTGVSGLSLQNKSGTVVWNATLNATANTDIDFFLRYSKFIKLGADGSISITQ